MTTARHPSVQDLADLERAAVLLARVQTEIPDLAPLLPRNLHERLTQLGEGAAYLRGYLLVHGYGEDVPGAPALHLLREPGEPASGGCPPPSRPAAQPKLVPFPQPPRGG